jgi:hypothetical protein
VSRFFISLRARIASSSPAAHTEDHKSGDHYSRQNREVNPASGRLVLLADEYARQDLAAQVTSRRRVAVQPPADAAAA